MKLKLGRFLQFAGAGKAPTGRTAALVKSGIALAVVLAVCIFLGLWLFFPTEVLRQRLIYEAKARAGVELRIGELSLLFPVGLEGSAVSVAADRPSGMAFTADSITARPLWLTLLSSRPGASLRARVQQGRIDATLRRGGAVEATLARVPFALPLAGSSSLAVAGTLAEGSYTGVLQGQNRPAGATRLRLVAADVRITGLEPLGLPGGAIALGTVTVQASGQGNSLRFEQLAASGGQLEMSGSGTLLLATPMPRSRVNLTLSVRPGRNFDESLAGLLAMFGQREADGSWRLQLSGTLSAAGAR